jgi:nitrite reductase (NADH) small subunit
MKINLGPVGAIPPGEGRNYDLAGERIAVFHTRSGEVFAVQAACPHKNGPLADGLVGNGTVICPLHAWKFDLKTGEPTFGNCQLKTYTVALDEARNVVLTWSVPAFETSAV